MASLPRLSPELGALVELDIDHGNVECALGERLARFLHIHRDDDILGASLAENILNDGGDQELVFDHQDPRPLQRPRLRNWRAQPGPARGIRRLRGTEVDTWILHRGLGW